MMAPFKMRYTIDDIRQLPEGQTFECKSIRADPKAPAITIVAMVNADGGIIAVGISDKTRQIEGVDRMCRELSEAVAREPQCRPDSFIVKATVYATIGRNNAQTTGKHPENDFGDSEGQSCGRT